MTFGYTVATRNARLDLITTAVDAGAGAATISLYTAPQPATGVAVTTQTLLATLTMSDPSFPAAAAGVLTANAITDDVSADATGLCTWLRIRDSDSNFVIDGTAGALASGEDLELTNPNIQSGTTVSITSFTITEDNA